MRCSARFLCCAESPIETGETISLVILSSGSTGLNGGRQPASMRRCSVTVSAAGRREDVDLDRPGGRAACDAAVAAADSSAVAADTSAAVAVADTSAAGAGADTSAAVAAVAADMASESRRSRSRSSA
ncbi:hypothetical protein [uncultured Victivallis sp.]|uniref:hypothetical protein n=1 Tax=uncultured Victivallis sp. TaxID=354118 RepID=UPI0025E87A40|nr:hypothetical protein [uncultured Victivallis sp.]